jgi:hypothetical protein
MLLAHAVAGQVIGERVGVVAGLLRAEAARSLGRVSIFARQAVHGVIAPGDLHRAERTARLAIISLLDDLFPLAVRPQRVALLEQLVLAGVGRGQARQAVQVIVIATTRVPFSRRSSYAGLHLALFLFLCASLPALRFSLLSRTARRAGIDVNHETDRENSEPF